MSQDAIKSEQQVIDDFYHRIDTDRADAERRISAVLRRETDDDPRAIVERERDHERLHERLAHLSAAEYGLCFGRIDVEDDDPENPVPDDPSQDRRYIGRIGLSDRDDDFRTLLMDWRAPQARPFYLATTAHPEGVSTRRHLRTRGRTVIRVDDEQLTGTADTQNTESAVGDESPLLAALNEARTGHMSDIVETIQREQDDIIRDPHRGVTVVEGGPGTGKTAVALHRAAYLLYTWRDQLAKTGVLILGPNRTFMEYISRVLPTLGEGGVVLSTIGELFPGVTATRMDRDITREVKGSEEMLTILGELVKSYQRTITRPEPAVIDGEHITLTPQLVTSARTRARRSRKPHNEAREFFRERFIANVVEAIVQQIGTDPLGGKNLLTTADREDLAKDLADDHQVEALIDRFWPLLTPTDVLGTFLTSREQIADVAADYDDMTQEALYCPETLQCPEFTAGPTGSHKKTYTSDGIILETESTRGASNSGNNSSECEISPAAAHRSLADSIIADSTDIATVDPLSNPIIDPNAEMVGTDEALDGSKMRESENTKWDFAQSDVALLDELTELLGHVDPENAAERDRKQWLDRIGEAQEALDILTGSATQDLDDGFAPEILMAYDLIDAKTLAERQRERDTRTTAERARVNRRWAYGHIIIDEAQELSAMEWRMIMRRSPNKWMTLVGDTAQTGSPAGVDQWGETLEPFVAKRWKYHQLSVNYRTPAAIMELANQLLPQLAPRREPDRCIRETERPVRTVLSGTDAHFSEVLTNTVVALEKEQNVLREGRSVAIIMDSEQQELSEAAALLSTIHKGLAFALETDYAEDDANIQIYGVHEIKGLEFDDIIVVEPARIAHGSTQGLNDLFVALTRATQGLTLLAREDLYFDFTNGG